MEKYSFFNLILVSALLLPNIVFANTQFDNNISPIFFASNNTGEIDLQTAYKRLKGEEQQKLQNETIELMQKERIEQSKFEYLLGTYKMSSDQIITADNSEKVITSYYQKLPSEKILTIAKKLANILNQDSIAVFMPAKKAEIGDTILKLKSHDYTINDIISVIHEKLPKQYSQAFSLHLNNQCTTFAKSLVAKVEWLGSKVNPEEIKKIFPQENVYSTQGDAYLVYKTGKVEKL